MRWWRRAEFLLAGGAVSLVWIALGQWLTEGWYWDYMYAHARAVEHRNLFALIFVKPTLKYALPWVLGIVVGLAMAARGPRRRSARWRRCYSSSARRPAYR
ncbi:hypothetical protein HS125_06825 [bacterium]|nr:hypothetical protein [bacterium]